MVGEGEFEEAEDGNSKVEELGDSRTPRRSRRSRRWRGMMVMSDISQRKATSEGSRPME